MRKIEALQKFLGLEDFSELIETELNLFVHGDREYRVLTDLEADENAKAQVLDRLWTFKPSFLWEKTRISEAVFIAIQKNGLCKSNNPAILSIVQATWSIADLVNSAISADGRGHFLAGYDNAENRQGEFFIYRIN